MGKTKEPSKDHRNARLRSRFNQGDPQPGRRFEAKSLTQQHFKDQYDVRNMFKAHGGPPPSSPNATKRPIFADFTGPDFLEVMNIAADAQSQFMGLPPAVRKRFGSPYNIVRFCEDPRNREEAIKLGFFQAPPTPAKAGSSTEGGNPPPTPSPEPAKAPNPAPPPHQGGLPNGDK